jgi:DNA polymerase V
MIALVDCNNFFVSCERLFRPSLADTPVAVLSNNDGCVVARSDEVKDLNVPMGAPHFQVKDIFAKNNVQTFSSNFALYSNISQRIISELGNFSPRLEVYSIDEAFMDLSDVGVDDYSVWSKSVKQHIQTNVGMPVSVGIAPTKTLAKLASEYTKRRKGYCVLDPKNDKALYQSILESIEVGEVWGIGRQHAKKLRTAGVRNVWQLVQASQDWLHSQMGINGINIHKELSGVVVHDFKDEKKPQKSLLASRSFGHRVTDLHELETAVASFSSIAAARLRKFDQATRLFGVFLHYKDDEGVSRYQSATTELLPDTNNTSELVEVALKLTRELYINGFGYKKAGVFAYNLSSSKVQQSTFLDEKTPKVRERSKQLMEAVDEINKRFGGSTINLATIDTRKSGWQGKRENVSPAYTTSWSQLPIVSASSHS